MSILINAQLWKYVKIGDIENVKCNNPITITYKVSDILETKPWKTEDYKKKLSNK